MNPEIFGLSSYFSFWVLAVLFGGLACVWNLRYQGLGVGRSWAVVAVVTALIIVGAKLFALADLALFPPAQRVFGVEGLETYLRRGFQIPGGALLAFLALFPLSRHLGHPPLRVGDAVAPAFALAMAFARFGCFLNGCCEGRVCQLPWAVRFPRGAEVFQYHLLEGRIGGPVSHSLPVHPLPLYYVLLGLLVFVAGSVWLRRGHREGVVFVVCAGAYFAGTLLLDPLRDPTIPINLIVSAAALGILAVLVSLRGSPFRPAGA